MILKTGFVIFAQSGILYFNCSYAPSKANFFCTFSKAVSYKKIHKLKMKKKHQVKFLNGSLRAELCQLLIKYYLSYLKKKTIIKVKNFEKSQKKSNHLKCSNLC